MRLADSFWSKRFGAVRIHELQRVIELDSGTTSVGAGSRIVPTETLRAVESQMVIVVPCMNESRSVIEGVLAGIPHDCQIVLVSNSDRLPVDRYEIEAQTVEPAGRHARSGPALRRAGCRGAQFPAAGRAGVGRPGAGATGRPGDDPAAGVLIMLREDVIPVTAG